MKPGKLEKKLMVVARGNPPGDDVAPFFENRIMALISGRAVYDLWATLARGLWFAAGPCVAVMLLFSTWAFFRPAPQPPSVDLAQQLNNTLLAAVDQDNNDSTW